MAHKKNKKKIRNHIVAAVALLLIVVAASTLLHLKGQRLANEEAVTIYLPHGTSYAAAIDSLNAHRCIDNKRAFHTLAQLRQYPDHVKPGRYKLEAHMNSWQALTKLYYGNQDPVQLTIGKYRTTDKLCAYIGRRLELDADTLLHLLSDSKVCERYGYTPQTITAMFVQNTYDIYWTTSPDKFLDRMKQEHDVFWNDKRRKQCDALQLTPDEVTTLASIVDEETNKNDEKADIASVYLNRLRKGMPLQADPTVKYAVDDFSLRRILNVHTATDSPYNTYRRQGLPPGPICIPSSASIDAVLQNKNTGYLFFCAKADFSGYHAFATTLAQHNANAAAFHAEMNRRKIYK